MENMYGIKRQLIHEQEKCLEQGREIKRLCETIDLLYNLLLLVRRTPRDLLRIPIAQRSDLLERAREISRKLKELRGADEIKTKDGIPVVPGVDKVFWPGDVLGPDLILIDATVALDVGLGGCVLYRSYRVFDRNGHAVSVSDSYSTTEAAEVAEGETV